MVGTTPTEAGYCVVRRWGMNELPTVMARSTKVNENVKMCLAQD